MDTLRFKSLWRAFEKHRRGGGSSWGSAQVFAGQGLEAASRFVGWTCDCSPVVRAAQGFSGMITCFGTPEEIAQLAEIRAVPMVVDLFKRPPRVAHAFTVYGMAQSGLTIRETARRLGLREWLRTMRKTWVRLRLPSGLTTGAPEPKSIWASSPGWHSIRRKGNGLVDRSRRTNRLTLS